MMLSDADIARVAHVMVYNHGHTAVQRADARYRTLLAERDEGAAVLWRQIRDYLAAAEQDGWRWRALRAQARPDPVNRLSGSHNAPIAR